MGSGKEGTDRGLAGLSLHVVSCQARPELMSYGLYPMGLGSAEQDPRQGVNVTPHGV